MNKVKKMVYLALLIAIEIILTRFVSIQTPIIRVGFGFIPVAIMGIMLGPIFAGTGAAMSDLIGVFLFPQGAFFPGFTLSAFVGGVIYGVLFYKKNVSLKRTLIAVILITVCVDLLMNTLWLTILTGKAASVLIIPRITKCVIMFPMQATLIYTVWRYAQKFSYEIKTSTIINKN